MKHHGQHPVIFVTFNNVEASQGKSESMSKLAEATILASIKRSISDMFRQHIYLRHALRGRIAKEKKEDGAELKTLDDVHLFDRLLIGYDQTGREQTTDELMSSIKYLSRMLYQHFKKEVYVLVDEYDAPINSSFGKSYFNYVVNVMHHIFKNGTKGNVYLEKTVMIGSLLLAKDNLLSGFDHFGVFTVEHNAFAKHFGFTEDEVDQLLSVNLEGDRDQLNRQKTLLKDWYNGYCIGEETLYNPCSIIMCLHTSQSDPEHALDAYWVYTGSLRLTKEAFKRFKYSGSTSPLTELINNGHVSFKINEHVELSKDNPISPYSIFSLMLHVGYLSRDPTQTNVYKIPNFEIKHSFTNESCQNGCNENFAI